MSRASDLARGLGAHVEAVCRHYLSNGRRCGRYWMVGEVSLTRRAAASMSGCMAPNTGHGAVGQWTEYVAARVMLRTRIGRCPTSDRRVLRNIMSAHGGGFVMPRDASELSRRLARDAEAVCRHYLSNGRRQGRYWTVGDVHNTPGRSMFVRLSGPESGPGAAGHWTDAASAEYGDLLDVIRESCGFTEFRDVADEARRFLSLPRAEPRRPRARSHACPRRIAGSGTAAVRRVAADPRDACRDLSAQSRHRDCPRRGRAAIPSALLLSTRTTAPTETWPAMIAAVTDLGADHRRASHLAVAGWLRQGADRDAATGHGRSARPCRPLWRGRRVLAVGEGIETMLSLRCALPAMPMAAALSANHLAAFCSLRRCAGSTSPATPMPG